MTILEVGYGWIPEESSVDGLSFKRGWLVVVLPVERKKRHEVNEMVKQQSIPAIRNWLIERKNLRLSHAHGIQSLRVLYDEEKDSLVLNHFQSPGEIFQ